MIGLIEGVQGELYSCKDSIFRKIYKRRKENRVMMMMVVGGLLGIIIGVLTQFGLGYLLVETEYRRRARQDRRDWEEKHGWVPGDPPAWHCKWESYEQGLERMKRVTKNN